MSKRSVICAAVRTPIGRFQGGLAPVRAPQLGAACVQAILARTGLDPAKVDEVILGCVCQAGSRDEALAGLVEAMRGYLAAINEVSCDRVFPIVPSVAAVPERACEAAIPMCG